MGAGGVMVPPEGYFPAIAAVCRKHDVLMISDEVICGFGRTGEWFGYQTLDFPRPRCRWRSSSPPATCRSPPWR